MEIPNEVSYRVDGMSCEHCQQAISQELNQLPQVEDVRVDLESKQVTVRGRRLEDRTLRAAIAEAGYEAA